MKVRSMSPVLWKALHETEVVVKKNKETKIPAQNPELLKLIMEKGPNGACAIPKEILERIEGRLGKPGRKPKGKGEESLTETPTFVPIPFHWTNATDPNSYLTQFSRRHFVCDAIEDETYKHALAKHASKEWNSYRQKNKHSKSAKALTHKLGDQTAHTVQSAVNGAVNVHYHPLVMTGQALQRGWMLKVAKDSRKLLVDYDSEYHVVVRITKKPPAPPLNKPHYFIDETSLKLGPDGEECLKQLKQIIENQLGGVVVANSTDRHHFYVVGALYDRHAKPPIVLRHQQMQAYSNTDKDILHPLDAKYSSHASTHVAQQVLDRGLCPEVFRQHHRVEHYTVISAVDVLTRRNPQLFDPSAKVFSYNALWWKHCSRPCEMRHCQEARAGRTMIEQNDIEMAVRAAYQLLPLPLFEESTDAGEPSSAAVYDRNEELVRQLGEITPVAAATAAPTPPRRSTRLTGNTPSDMITSPSGFTEEGSGATTTGKKRRAGATVDSGLPPRHGRTSRRQRVIIARRSLEGDTA